MYECAGQQKNETGDGLEGLIPLCSHSRFICHPLTHFHPVTTGWMAPVCPASSCRSPGRCCQPDNPVKAFTQWPLKDAYLQLRRSSAAEPRDRELNYP